MPDRVNLTDRVHAYLRNAIVSGELENGSLHSVYRLAEQLGVSRTPVREAVLRLADTGMVTVERNRGIRIHGITVEDIRQIFELRLLLEVPAAACAAAADDAEPVHHELAAEGEAMRTAAAARDEEAFRRHDRALHDAIAAVTGNPRLSSVIGDLRDATVAHGAWTGDGVRDLVDIIEEHDAIVAAVVEGDTAAAARAMHTHIVRTGTLLMQQVSGRTGEAVPVDWSSRWKPPTSLDQARGARPPSTAII